MLYLLDTDHLSLFQRGHVTLKSRLSQFPPLQVVTTDVSYEEQMRGRLAQIKAACNELEIIQAYDWLRATVSVLKDFSLLAYDAKASGAYETLRQQKLRIGTQQPVAQGSFQPTFGGTVGGSPVVQFTTIDVGVDLDLTPRVLMNRDIAMNVNVKIKSEVPSSETLAIEEAKFTRWSSLRIAPRKIAPSITL